MTNQLTCLPSVLHGHFLRILPRPRQKQGRNVGNRHRRLRVQRDRTLQFAVTKRTDVTPFLNALAISVIINGSWEGWWKLRRDIFALDRWGFENLKKNNYNWKTYQDNKIKTYDHL